MKKTAKFVFGLFFACLILLWLPARNALAVQLFSGEVYIAFPAHTSIQLCPRNDGQPWTGAECREYLDSLRASFHEHPDDPSLHAEMARRGDFGARPLYLRSATVLICREDGCEPLKDFRVPPADMAFRAPDVVQWQGGLVWHRPSQVVGEPLLLSLQGLDRKWRSTRFRAYFPVSYMNAKLGTGQSGHLLIAHDWMRELQNDRNLSWLKSRIAESWVVWGILLAVAWGSLPPMRLLQQAPTWRELLRIGIAFSLTLYPVALLIDAIVATFSLERFGLLPAVVLYGLLAPIEFVWFVRVPGLQRKRAWRLWLAHKIMFTMIGCTAFLITALWVV